MSNKSNDPFELDYMPPIVAASRRQARKFAVVTMGVVIGLVLLFLAWASLAEIDESVRGNGKIIPSSKTQMIANLEGGIIEEVFVREGDLVEPNQILMRIDKTIAQARYSGDRTQYVQFLATAARLRAQISGEDFVVPEIIQEEAPDVAAEEMNHYRESIAKVENEIAIAQDEVNQKKQELLEFEGKLEQSQEEKGFAEQELAMIEPLVKRGLTAKRDLLRLKRDISDLKGEISSANANIPRARSDFEQAQKELNKVKSDLRNQDLEQLRDIEVRLAEAQGQMTEYGDRMNRTDLRSPVKGIVKDVKVKTVGGVIEPGEDVIEIVPYEDKLLVEANINPKDVAFIHPGQKATVKVTAYDYAVYGSLEANLEGISADTSYDEQQQQWFYRIWLRTDDNHLEKAGEVLPIIPGMTAEVDILTNKRTVLQYILKPIIRGLDRSFTER